MPSERRKLAVVIGPPGNRKRQEVELFKECPHFGATLVLSSMEKPWIMEGVDYSYAELVKLAPDFLAGFVVRKPYSPVSFVKLAHLEACLEDVEVINCIEPYSFISRQCAEIAGEKGKKLVVSVFDTVTSLFLHRVPPFSRNVKTVLRQTDVFLAYSNRSREYLQRLSVPKEKIKVIYPGVDLQIFHPSYKRRHESVRVLFVGGFAGEKGVNLLLRAFSKLSIDEFEVELWMCLRPRSKRENALIEAYSRKYPIKTVGNVSYEKMPDVYRQCDVFCLPSFDKRKWGIKVWEEQFGFALVEAMASGLPIVATNCGAVPEIVGNENLIVPQKSVEALYVALRKLAKDADYRLYLAKKNRNHAERRYDIEQQRIMVNRVLGEL